jgi:predicted transcriptional regulator
MKNENKSEEVKRAIENALSGVTSGSAEEFTERVLQVLDRKKVLRYHNEGVINLLSTAGRVLVVLMEDPTMTQRAVAVYLGLSETMIDRTVKSLITAGLITKTKVNRQNVYQINKNLVENHPDIQRVISAIVNDQPVNIDQQIEEDPF